MVRAGGVHRGCCCDLASQEMYIMQGARPVPVPKKSGLPAAGGSALPKQLGEMGRLHEKSSVSK